VVVQNVHHAESRDHNRLGFHPDCPVCRQDRLFGALSPEPIWPRRLRVLLAAGVLAVSAGATSTSVASEPDGQQEGVVVPAPGDSPPVGDGPDQGGDTALPFEVDPVLTTPETGPTGEQPDSAAPLEAAPVDDPDGRLALGDPNAPAEDDPPAVDPGEVDANDAPVPPAEPIPPGTSAPATPPSGDPGNQTGAADPTPAAKPEQQPRKQRQRRNRHAARKRARGHTRGELRAANPPATSAPSQEAPALANDTQAATAAAAAPTPPRIRGRFHVVLPGESLWSIASALLDSDASSAAVALEVRRLWRLNEARIGTGDPNLLRIGVRLRLR
jgi:hypothetical protein